MNDRQAFGNFLWMIVFLAALTSPFWGHWLFGLGVLLMAIASELRMEHPGFRIPEDRPPVRRRAAGLPAAFDDEDDDED